MCSTISSQSDLSIPSKASFFLITSSPSHRQPHQTSEMTSTQATGKCAVCDTETTQECTGCLDGLDDQVKLHDATFYCSLTCEMAAKPNHKALCKQLNVRKQLHCAGNLIQDAIYGFRERIFDITFGRIEKQESKIHAYCMQEISNWGRSASCSLSDQGVDRLTLGCETKKEDRRWQKTRRTKSYARMVLSIEMKDVLEQYRRNKVRPRMPQGSKGTSARRGHRPSWAGGNQTAPKVGSRRYRMKQMLRSLPR